MNTAAILITTALVIANSVGMHVMTGAVSSIDKCVDHALGRHDAEAT